MLFRKASSPFFSANASVHTIMYKVLYALVPGTLAAIYFFGWGVLINLLIASIVCLGSEALVLKLRQRPLAALSDGSALITACLLALALPPLVPWWLTSIASLFAIVIAKQLYGGLGFNLFNPAMVGYIVVMISFPREMTFWTPPLGIAGGWPTFTDTLNIIFGGTLSVAEHMDSITMATPIDTLKTQIGLEHDIDTTRNHKVYGALFGSISGVGWEWINGLFLLGGLWLLQQKVADWRIPVSFLLSLLLISNFFPWSITRPTVLHCSTCSVAAPCFAPFLLQPIPSRPVQHHAVAGYMAPVLVRWCISSVAGVVTRMALLLPSY